MIVRGAAEVTLNGKAEHVHENELIYLPIGSTHRLANPGKIDLELIEVQTGSYLGEDDIVRHRRRLQPEMRPWRRRFVWFVGRSASAAARQATAQYRMGRNYLAGTHGDAANAVLAAASCNSRRLLE